MKRLRFVDVVNDSLVTDRFNDSIRKSSDPFILDVYLIRKVDKSGFYKVNLTLIEILHPMNRTTQRSGTDQWPKDRRHGRSSFSIHSERYFLRAPRHKKVKYQSCINLNPSSSSDTLFKASDIPFGIARICFHWNNLTTHWFIERNLPAWWLLRIKNC